MQSQTTSELRRILSLMEPTKAGQLIAALKAAPLANQKESENARELKRQRKKRSEAAAVTIGPVADPKRKAACLADPVLFLKTYGLEDDGTETFYNDFALHHLAMIAGINERAISGGDLAVAAPRGDRKSTVAIWMAIYIILAGHIRSLVIIAATRKHAQKLFKKLKKAFSRNELLAADFPEVCDCVRELDGAPQRAAKQHVNGKRTGIVWTQDEIVFPFVEGSDLGGVHVAYYGLDSAIRGGRFEFALIDDPETREVAFSDEQNKKVEEMIDGDVAGLAGPNTAISRVVLTTIQNRRSYSYRVTDRSLKPTFAGARYGMLTKWPTNTDLWDEYIAKRQAAQSAGDKDGLKALTFYRKHRKAMEAGAVVSNPHRYNRRKNAAGRYVEISAIQSFFNKVADWGLERVRAELQNNPVEDEVEETLGITPGVVATRISGLSQNILPNAPNVKITVGIDIGNYSSHWVKIAWFGNASGVIIDEGELITKNMIKNPEQSFLNKSLLDALLGWRTNMLSENPPDLCFIDSGSGFHQPAVYEFVRRIGGIPFAAAKGWDIGRFRLPPVNEQGQAAKGKRVFQETYAHYQPDAKLWLYNINTEYWKNWLQERFLTPTFDDQQKFNDGSLSLHSTRDPKRWLEFSNQICAEGREEIFVPGSGYKSSWKVYNKRNHKLDATMMACAAGGVLGLRLIARAEKIRSPAQRAAPQRKPKQPKPGRFQRRNANWVNRKGRRR